MTDYRELLALDNPSLARVDPLVRNLLVAKGIPALADLDIPRYQRVVDGWAEEMKAWLRHFEPQFHEDPAAWENDLNFFNLGVLCRYVEEKLGVQYKEDQREARSVRYTNASDLFLNGLIDTRRGTCGNMASLLVAISWRLGWPVSLACARSHLFLRYDDGRVRYNVEATRAGLGGMSAPPDEYYVKQYSLPPEAIQTGSDLRTLSPREVLGVFLGLRARHFRDTRMLAAAEGDYLLARWLFPAHRGMYGEALGVSVLWGMHLFHVDDIGSPLSLADWIRDQYRHQRA